MPPKTLAMPAYSEQQLDAVVKTVIENIEGQYEKTFLRPLDIRVTVRRLVVRLLQHPLQTIDRVSHSTILHMKQFLSSIITEQNRARENISAHDSDADLVAFEDKPSRKPFGVGEMTPGRLDKAEPSPRRSRWRSAS